MEAFSLLKYWRGGGGGAAAAAAATLSTTDNNSNAAAAATTAAILTAVAQTDIEIDDDDSDNDDDDGPFFDLEFTLPDDSEDSPHNLNEDHTASDSENHSEEETEENINNNNINEDSDVDVDDDEDDGESEREIKFKLSPSSNDRSDPNLSDDVVFKGELVQLEPSSFVLNSSEPNSKPQFTASLLKSATKFRVYMLGLKKPKPNNNSTSTSTSEKEKDPNGSDPAAPSPKQQRKLFTVKFKVEEVPIMSLFTRDNSSKGAKAVSAASTNNKDETESQTHPQTKTQSISSASEEKRLMQKYLRMVKPLYVKVSRRYAEKLRFSGQLNMSDSVVAEKPAPAKAVAAEKEGDVVASEVVGKGQKQGNLPLPAGLRVVCKHLGKSRSASSVAVPVAAPAQAPTGLVSSKRRDDSLLQQQDGIQGAILHCKRSFNASRECESSQLPRSVSDPLHELSRKSTTEGNDKRP